MHGVRFAFLLAVTIFSLTPVAGFAQTSVYNLPSQPLAESLKAVGARAGVNILVAPSLVDATQAPALNATLSVAEALTRLLAGTHLEFHFIDDQTVVIREKAVSGVGDGPSARPVDPPKETDPTTSQDSRSGRCASVAAEGCPEVTPVDTPLALAAASPETVVVSGRQLPVETLLDRKIYSVTSDVQSSLGALSDVLANIPSVNVDADGIVSLRGDSHVLILLDGKPSALFTGPSAGDNLQAFPAKDIERIEIITTPPPEFKAQGASGIINIITRKKKSDGLTGSLQGSAGNGGRTVDGANGSFHSGPLTLSATASYRHDFRDRVIQSDVSAPDSSTGELSASQSSLRELIERSLPTAGLTAEYALNDRQSITGSVRWAERFSDRHYTEFDSTDTPPGTVTSVSQTRNDRHDTQTDYDDHLSFSQKLSRPGESLELTVSHWTSSLQEHWESIEDALVPPAAATGSALALRQHYETTEAQADYVLPLSKSNTLKLGYSFDQDDYSFQDVGDDVDIATGMASPELGVADDFKYREQVHAWYASYQSSRGALGWLGGLRAELTRLGTQELTQDSATSGSYLKLFPSLHVDYALSDIASLSLGASSRVTRPDPEYLNPYVDHEYSPNLRSGNPYLSPEYTHSFELGYGFDAARVNYSLTAYYRLNRDSMTDVRESLGDGLTLGTEATMPKDDAAGLEGSAYGSIGSKLTYSISGNLFHRQIDATELGVSELQSTTGLDGKIKLDYRLSRADSAEIAATHTDKVLTPQGYVGAINIVNVGYKRQLWADLAAVVTISDLFNGQRYRQSWESPGLTENYLRYTRGRIAYVGLVYSLGVKKDKAAKFDYDKVE